MSDITSSGPTGHQVDLESQKTELLPTSSSINPARHHWRWIIVILQVHKLLISSRANKATKGSQSLPQLSSSTTPYAIISTSTTTDDAGAAYSQLTSETREILPALPQVSGDGRLIGEDDRRTIAKDAKLQHASIAKIVKEKDLESLQTFGCVQGIAEALNTDLQKGILGDEEDVSSRCTVGALSTTQAHVRGFFKFVLHYSNNYTVILLLVFAVLSIGFGIKEEGPSTGWYEGAIILFVIIILVVAPSIRDLWLQDTQSHEVRQTSAPMAVEVLRGGLPREVAIGDVVSGDLVCLKRGSVVPGDGLFVSGEFLVLDDGRVATINEKRPFVFYGSKVVGGNGRMLVTSVGMDTAWGELMNKVANTPNRAHLPAQLDKVTTGTQIIGLSISILNLVVFFTRFMIKRDYNHSGHPDLEGKPTLFVTLAISYWNKKTLSGKATAQGILGCVTMGSVTTICTDKTGVLTLNTLEVDKCYIGGEVIEIDDYVTGIDTRVRQALWNGISTPILMPSNPHSRSTEDPLLSWADINLGAECEILRQNGTILEAQELSTNEEGSGVLMRKGSTENEGDMCLHWKGP